MRIIILLLAVFPLLFAMLSVRDTEMRYKRITDKIRSTR